MNPLSKRARSVLYAVVTEFIASGEPVGSRLLSKKYGFSLSAATIRNVLADLEDEGYLAQPHTSAGRIPTELAFRLFVDALMQVQKLPEDDAGRISEWLAELRPDADIPRETGKLLADLSGAPAVILRARAETRTLLKLRFIATRPGEMLAVAVFLDGTVENRFLRLEVPIADSELERLHGMLEEVAPGRTLPALRDAIHESMSVRRAELGVLHELGYSLVRSTAESAARVADVVIEGQTLLLDRPEFGNVERMRELLRALDDRERLVGLLDRALVSDRVQVFLGDETSGMGFPVSVVAARYQERGEPGGAVGVIGPTRMDYPVVVPLVAAAAEAMSAAIARSTEPRDPNKPNG
ncbi:MAG TPA: heat-inducible transcriptional repressor HrcA [Polyangiaceae bacterium]|nr:heat-inducible transcriptional repressor HrcA [Polyangiaceae bacterium]